MWITWTTNDTRCRPVDSLPLPAGTHATPTHNHAIIPSCCLREMSANKRGWPPRATNDVRQRPVSLVAVSRRNVTWPDASAPTQEPQEPITGHCTQCVLRGVANARIALVWSNTRDVGERVSDASKSTDETYRARHQRPLVVRVPGQRPLRVVGLWFTDDTPPRRAEWYSRSSQRDGSVGETENAARH